MIHAQGSPGDAPHDPFVEREEVQFVTLDVTVERKGPDGWKPAAGLRREQFRVHVGGFKVNIESFEARCGDSDSPEPDPDGPSRYILAFAENSLSFEERHDVYRAAIRWAGEDAHPADEVMVISLGSRIRVLRRMVAASPSLAEDLETARRDVSNFNPELGGRGLRSTFEALRDLMAAFERFPGRKNMIFFTCTLGISNQHLHYLREFTEAASDRDVRIYPVLAAGMGGRASGALSMLASETGGQVIEGTNQLGMVFDRIEEDLSCYYRLGFRLLQEHKGASKNVSVRVKGSPGRERLYYRRMLRDPTPERREIEGLMSAFLDPPAVTAFPVTVTPFPLYPHPQRSRVRVQVSVALEDLLALPAADHGSGSRTISFLVGGRFVPVGDRREGGAGSTSRGVWADIDTARSMAGFSGQVRLVLPEERPGSSARRRATLVEDLYLEPGSYRVVAVVHDEHARSISTDLADIHVDAAPEALGPISLAVKDPLTLVVSLGSEDDEGGSSRWKKKGARPEDHGLLPSRALLTDSSSIEAGRDAYFVYGICDQKDPRLSPAWLIARAVTCSNGTGPLVLSQRHAPRLSRGSPCSTLVDPVPAAALVAGKCTFEVSLAPPEGSSASFRQSLDFVVTEESRSEPAAAADGLKGEGVAPRAWASAR